MSLAFSGCQAAPREALIYSHICIRQQGEVDKTVFGEIDGAILSLPIFRTRRPCCLTPSGLGCFCSLALLQAFDGEHHTCRPAPYSLRLPCGPACGCYSAALRLLAALALRASLRLLLRFAPFTRCACPSGQPAAVTPLRSVYSLRSPFGLACGHYFAALRLLAALALRASLRLLLRFAPFGQEAKSTKCSRANKPALPQLSAAYD